MLATALEASNTVEGQEEAAITGEVREEPARMVVMHTQFGGTRMIDMPVGNPLPRIYSKMSRICK
jgi:hydrogenase expression/formation protein HypE